MFTSLMMGRVMIQGNEDVALDQRRTILILLVCIDANVFFPK